MRTSIRLDDDLLREAKSYAAATHRTLDRLFEDTLREALPQRQVQKRRRVRLPTSGSGDLQPGVDISDRRRSGPDGRHRVIAACLAAVAVEHRCELITTDREFARLKGLRSHPLT